MNLTRNLKLAKNKEVKEIIETQRVLDEVMVANSDAIKQIKHEIVEMKDVEKPVEACNGENNVNSNETGIEKMILPFKKKE